MAAHGSMYVSLSLYSFYIFTTTFFFARKIFFFTSVFSSFSVILFCFFLFPALRRLVFWTSALAKYGERGEWRSRSPHQNCTLSFADVFVIALRLCITSRLQFFVYILSMLSPHSVRLFAIIAKIIFSVVWLNAKLVLVACWQRSNIRQKPNARTSFPFCNFDSSSPRQRLFLCARRRRRRTWVFAFFSSSGSVLYFRSFF